MAFPRTRSSCDSDARRKYNERLRREQPGRRHVACGVNVEGDAFAELGCWVPYGVPQLLAELPAMALALYALVQQDDAPPDLRFALLLGGRSWACPPSAKSKRTEQGLQ